MPRRSLLPRPLFLLTFAAATTLLAGCGTLHGSAQGGSGMKPRFGTSISVPLGK